MKLIRNIVVLFVLLAGSGLKAQSCVASFTYIDSVGYVFFINNSSPGSSGNYIWDFGDGNYSYLFSPSNQHASPGSYQVCLIAYDSMQNFCDSTCMTINAQSNSTAAGVEETAVTFGQVQISPNPAQDLVTVNYTMNQPGEICISIYDLTGRIISSSGVNYHAAGQQQQQFSASALSAGTYLVRIETKGELTNKKLIIAQ